MKIEKIKDTMNKISTIILLLIIKTCLRILNYLRRHFRFLDGFSFREDNIKLTVRDALTDRIILEDCQSIHNLTLTSWKNLVGDAMVAAGNINLTHCGVGSSTQAPASGDTDLIIPIGSMKMVTDISRTGFVILASTYFGSGDNNGSWNECVLANSASAGNARFRALFASTFTKNSAKTATVDWSITIS